MKEDVIKARLDRLIDKVERIDDRLEPKRARLSIDESVQHSLIWGGTIILLALIIKWVIA